MTTSVAESGVLILGVLIGCDLSCRFASGAESVNHSEGIELEKIVKVIVRDSASNQEPK